MIVGVEIRRENGVVGPRDGLRESGSPAVKRAQECGIRKEQEKEVVVDTNSGD